MEPWRRPVVVGILTVAFGFRATAVEGPPANFVEGTPEARDAAIRAAVKFLDANIPKMQEGGSPQRHYAVATAAWAGLLLSARKGAPGFEARKLESLRESSERYVESVSRAYDGQDKDRAKAGKQRDREREERPPAAAPGVPEASEIGGEATQFVWPLSMATHLFAESAARGWKKEESLTLLARVVKVFEASQQPDGGWGHDDASRPGLGLPPLRFPGTRGEGDSLYPRTFLAATNCALSALGTAHRALGTKSPSSLVKGRKYFADAQNADGTFPYDPSQREAGGRAARTVVEMIQISRTAGSLFALACAGAGPDDPVLARAALALEGRTAILSEGHGSATMTLQLAALACRSRGAGEWAAFRKEFLPRILSAQDPDGAFRCACREACFGVSCDSKLPPLPVSGAESFTAGGRVFVTAAHLLILALDADEPPKALPRIAIHHPEATPK